ncbi:hypothetical protein SADUNF_Sadunf12G0031300 [Salix dunnii]|uniref:DUF4283 domain-containing protein n=1 Tax=Salix dunnii TaxID=1413687 RepID=A0A835JMJ5_9ROSI|nr:hypothetical protein SADUNF_Sadunf12G0031300 [Salix dunnii]
MIRERGNTNGKHLPHPPQRQNAGRKAPTSWAEKVKVTNATTWFTLEPMSRPIASHQLGLSMVASIVGTLLSCDEPTHRYTRLEYARICVEIDAALPYVHQFEVLTALSPSLIPIQVEYEWKPSRCDTCKVFGHTCAERAEDEATRVPYSQVERGETDMSSIQASTLPQNDKGGDIDQTKMKGKELVCTENNSLREDVRESSTSMPSESPFGHAEDSPLPSPKKKKKRGKHRKITGVISPTMIVVTLVGFSWGGTRKPVTLLVSTLSLNGSPVKTIVLIIKGEELTYIVITINVDG